MLNNIIEKLRTNDCNKEVLIGFDGFVDEIIHVVDERVSQDNYTRIDSISEFANRIAGAAGLSANIELVPSQLKLGGNGPIMANALLEQKHEITYIGSLGKSSIHDVFKDFADKCKRVISITDPAHTDALEFFDGKLMLGKMNKLPDVNWFSLLEKTSIEDLKEMLKNVSLISFNNWTMLSQMNTIMTGIDNIIKDLDIRPGLFVDLADPQKRTTEDIRGVLSLLSEMQKNSDVILSMNKRESEIISDVLSISEEDITKRAVLIREKLGLSQIVIHPLEGAAVATKDTSAWVKGPYTEKPKLTTGAGDNFNAGFCNGWLHGLEPKDNLKVGVYTSGFYVRECHSPSSEQLIEFMQNYNSK